MADHPHEEGDDDDGQDHPEADVGVQQQLRARHLPPTPVLGEAHSRRAEMTSRRAQAHSAGGHSGGIKTALSGRRTGSAAILGALR